MKKITRFLLKQYAKMSGEKKIKIAMDMSETARKVRAQGATQTKTKIYGRNKPATTS